MSSLTGPVVLFDGVCNLCNGAVNFIIDRDRSARFRFASLQSSAAKTLLQERAVTPPAAGPDGIETVYLVDGDGVWDRSEAILRIASGLGWRWSWLGVFRLVPKVLRDGAYRWVARNRYSWFGRTEACRVPTPELRARFLPEG